MYQKYYQQEKASNLRLRIQKKQRSPRINAMLKNDKRETKFFFIIYYYLQAVQNNMDDFLFDDNFSGMASLVNFEASYYLNSNIEEESFEKDEKKRTVDTNDSMRSETPQITFWEENPVQFHEQGLYIYSENSHTVIDTNKELKKKNIAIKIGIRDQTKDLTVNLKQLTQKLMLQNHLFDKISPELFDVFQKFKTDKNNIEAFRQLFGIVCVLQSSQNDQENKILYDSARADEIRKNFMIQISSGQAVKKIMKSNGMNFRNKLICLKFLEVLRKGCVEPQNFVSWKEGL